MLVCEVGTEEFIPVRLRYCSSDFGGDCRLDKEGATVSIHSAFPCRLAELGNNSRLLVGSRKGSVAAVA